MGIVVDGRTRIARQDEQIKDSHDQTQYYSLSTQFGNVMTAPFLDCSADDLTKKPLSSVADKVQELLSVALMKETFLGVIDWVQVHCESPLFPVMYCTRGEDELAFVVSSGLRFPVWEVDFGWGTPGFGSYHLAWESLTAYVMPRPSPKRNGDWVVFIHCRKDHLECLEEVAGDLLKPLSPQYLNLAT